MTPVPARTCPCPCTGGEVGWRLWCGAQSGSCYHLVADKLQHWLKQARTVRVVAERPVVATAALSCSGAVRGVAPPSTAGSCALARCTNDLQRRHAV